jgi:uncharacterized protein
MGRPKCDYQVDCCVPYTSFGPEGQAVAQHVELTPEELESLRLKNLENMDQTQAAAKMGISQSTFQRVLSSAYKKVSEALIEGKELRILPKD